LSGIISAALWLGFRSTGLALGSFCTGVFIDLDHWVDYFRDYGFPKSLGHFFDAAYDRTYSQAHLPLHGWEWLAVGAAVTWCTSGNEWVLGALVGWTHHLVADQVMNRPSRWGYSLLYRWKTGFDFKAAFPD
jgi:hypothetical protein